MHVPKAQEILESYYKMRGYDAALEDYKSEVASLPGEFGPPHGIFYLAYYDGKPVGCIALHKLDDEICEMKRLYVLEGMRGKRIGVGLVEKLIAKAKEIGYITMRLDNHPWMVEAEGIYYKFGFKRIDAYRYNPTPGTKFFELDMRE